MSKKITTSDLDVFMRSRWPNDGGSYHFFTELRMGTGWSCERAIDGYLMELWPSKGFERTAFEYKISRGDFLRELKNPQKSQTVKHFSDYFVFVTANEVVKDKSEIPKDCGWYVFNGDGLDIKIKPPRLPPSPYTEWSFASALIRHAFKDGKNPHN